MAFVGATRGFSMGPLATLVAVCLLMGVSATRIDQVVHPNYDGIITYHKVDRVAVQNRLDVFYNETNLRLFLPNRTVFPNDLTNEQHVVFFDLGEIWLSDFENYTDRLMVKALSAGFTIPYLTDEVGGTPHYSLTLARFYESGEKEFTNPDFAYPVVAVDQLRVTEGEFLLRQGDEEMRAVFERESDPCVQPVPVVRHEFDGYISHTRQIGAMEPDFGVCESFPYDNTYCDIVGDIGDAVYDVAPNFCQLSWYSRDKVSCKASFDIVNVTPKFRLDYFLLGEDSPIEMFATETLTGHFSIGIQYPCIEV